MFTPPTRRILRPRSLILGVLATLTVYYVFISGSTRDLLPYYHEGQSSSGRSGGVLDNSKQTKDDWDIDIEQIREWSDPDDHENPHEVEPGYETDGKVRNEDQISKLQPEKDMRKLWRYLYKASMG